MAGNRLAQRTFAHGRAILMRADGRPPRALHQHSSPCLQRKIFGRTSSIREVVAQPLTRAVWKICANARDRGCFAELREMQSGASLFIRTMRAADGADISAA